MTTMSFTLKSPRPLTRMAVAVALTGGLVLAGCGSDDASTSAGSSASSAPATSAAPATTAASGGAMTSDSPAAGGEAAMSFGPGCAAVPASGAGSFAGMAQDPAATAASNNPVLSTLVSAVKEAGLVDTLNGPGPFTIFAPTNDAFAALPAATRDKVLGDKDLLTQVLTYHVVAGDSLDAKALGSAGRRPAWRGRPSSWGPTAPR